MKECRVLEVTETGAKRWRKFNAWPLIGACFSDGSVIGKSLKNEPGLWSVFQGASGRFAVYCDGAVVKTLAVYDSLNAMQDVPGELIEHIEMALGKHAPEAIPEELLEL